MIKLTPEKPPYYENVEQRKIYRALIDQLSTNAPTAIEITNTIGKITWEYVSPGIYYANKTGAFPTTTWADIVNVSGNAAITTVIVRENANRMMVTVKNAGTPEDGWIGNNPVIIIT